MTSEGEKLCATVLSLIANDPVYVLVRRRVKETKPLNLSCETNTAKHEAECFAQRNCDVIQNGAEKVNGRSNEKTRVSFRLHAQGTYAITGSPED